MPKINKIFELDGEKYIWNGKGWFNSKTFVVPPGSIVQKLNVLLEESLTENLEDITDEYELVKKAKWARKNKQLNMALKLTEKLLLLFPDNFYAPAILCGIYRDMKKPEKAIEKTQNFRKNPSLALILARSAAFCDLELWEQAKNELSIALAMEKHSNNPAAFLILNRIKSAKPDLYEK